MKRKNKCFYYKRVMKRLFPTIIRTVYTPTTYYTYTTCVRFNVSISAIIYCDNVALLRHELLRLVCRCFIVLIIIIIIFHAPINRANGAKYYFRVHVTSAFIFELFTTSPIILLLLIF